jgi:hypothetical protein
MKVKDLIKKLEAEHPEAEVFIETEEDEVLEAAFDVQKTYCKYGLEVTII